MTTPSGNESKTTDERVWDDELEIDYQRILTVGEECISATELKALLVRKGRGTDPSNKFILYDGFEPSGRMHIAQGVFKAMNVNKCTVPAVTNSQFVFWVADWFALMNDKMGGDLDKIKTVGVYLIEVWKAAGMDLSNVVFKWASDEITTHAATYWPLMLDIARRFTITRIKKCCQIMGRLEGNLSAAQILYPIMQCTDVFFLKADICQLGVDQRKVNMLAREYCDAAKRKIKPIILSHHMLYGLKAGQEKMSKSDPDSAIFMEDSIEDVTRKITNAYCPNAEASSTGTVPGDTVVVDAGKESLQLIEDKLKNPCLDYIKNIIFSPPGATFTTGDGVLYTTYNDVYEGFINGTISETNLKQGLINELNRLLQPVRDHFTNDETAKNLLQLVQQYKKESLIPSVDKDVRRLDLVKLQKVPAGSHLVFIPPPTAQPTVQMIFDVITQLRQRLSDEQPCVLLAQDWSAIVTNACNADSKVISAYYTIFIKALEAFDATLMQSGIVRIVYQSEAILFDPSNYWINVINIGRHFKLNEIMGTQVQDEDTAGYVIARLMKLADITAVEPTSIGFPSSTDHEISTASLEQTLVQNYYAAKLPGYTIPTIHTVASIRLRLQPVRESEALQTENDEYYVLDDPKVHGKSKFKKAFCEPGNITFCPPIALANALVFTEWTSSSSTTNTLEVVRSPENGGTKIYTTVQELETDFQQGDNILHPGDLKNSVVPHVLSILERISTAIASDKATTTASKTLKAFLKKKK